MCQHQKPSTLLLISSIVFGVFISSVASADTPYETSVRMALEKERQNALPLTDFYRAPSLADSRPGDLLRKQVIKDYTIGLDATAVRVLYHSQAADGRDVATSAVIFIPAGPPPEGGWPMIAWAHGTSGVAQTCAPSLTKDVYYGDLLNSMIRAGFAVVATDYHGLGTIGPHQYANKKAQGHDVVYSIPAARAAVSTLGQSWVAVGHSQGGLAAWGVAELEAQKSDAGYHGAVSVAGASDVRDLWVNWSASGKDAAFYMPYMAYGVTAVSSDFTPAQMLIGTVFERYADVTTKGCWGYASAMFLDLPSTAEVVKSGWDRIPAVKRYLTENQLGNMQVAQPLLIIAGEKDGTVSLASMKKVVHRACEKNISLEFRTYPFDHGPTMNHSLPDILKWVRDRLDDKPALNSCPEFLE
jgi:pimeloyl-ACP methyl ester carboxylesterase